MAFCRQASIFFVDFGLSTFSSCRDRCPADWETEKAFLSQNSLSIEHNYLG